MLGPAVYSAKVATDSSSSIFSAASTVLARGFILCLKEMMLLFWASYDLKEKKPP